MSAVLWSVSLSACRAQMLRSTAAAFIGDDGGVTIVGVVFSQPIPAIVECIHGRTGSGIGKMEIDELAKPWERLEDTVMNHAAFVGFTAEETTVVVLALVVQLAGNDDAIVINAVFGNNLHAGSVVLSDIAPYE